MRTPRPFPQGSKESLKICLEQAKTKSEYQRVLCVRMRAQKDLPAKDIADLIGLRVDSVRRIHSLYLKHGDKIFQGLRRGGRRRENLSKEDEQALLNRFFKKAEEGRIVVVNEVKAAYEQKVGHKVPKSTVYRMLGRHGWRKIIPYRRHPKADSDKQEVFKKNFLA
jgi:transposase